MSHTDFSSDAFTEADVLRCLDFAGERYRIHQRYILSTCPMPEHVDKNPSAQIFRDDWFVNCLAGCGRFHITKAYPELRDIKTTGFVPPRRKTVQSQMNEPKRTYVTYDQIEEWNVMPAIPRDHTFKNIPLEVLDYMGWRWDEANNSYYIPYFDANKEHIPFSQLRHLSGKRRFTFLLDAQPTIYGKWNIPDATLLFMVEGASDAACMEYAGIPWVAIPSAAFTSIVELFADYCLKHSIRVVYAGDNDGPENNYAGDNLRKALEAKMRYLTCQPPTQYKDWCDFLAAEGIDAVRDYTFPELGVCYEAASNETFSAIASMFPGAIAIEEAMLA